MDTKKLLAEFRYIISTPEGIKNLREMIFSLAVNGHLVPQNHKEQSALEFLTTSWNEIEHMNTNWKSKYQETSEKEIAFKLPRNWNLLPVRLLGKISNGNSISEIDRALKYSKVKEGLPFISTKDVGYGRDKLVYNNGVKIPFNEPKFKVAPARSILICCEGGSAGKKIGITEQEICFGNKLLALTTFDGLIPEYALLVYQSPIFFVQFKNRMTGIIGGISINQFKEILIPVPPPSEQLRIVAKANELIALCDKLESQQQEREILCKLTRTAILKALANTEDPLKLETAWIRVNANTSLILGSKQGVIDLQYSLTNLAVRGLLSKWTQDLPLIDEIKRECNILKQEYISKEWLRKRQPIVSNFYENNLYPSHWGVVTLDEVAIIIGGVTKGHKLKGENVSSHPYLRVANVQRGFFDLTEIKQIEVPVHQVEKYRVEIGDLLITEGGDWDKVGRTAIWAGEVADCLHQNHIFKVRIPSSLLVNEWVELVLNSEIGRNYFAGASKQTTNLASINMTQLRSFPLPIPPFSEQIAILQKIKYLFSICQKLERQLVDLNNVASLFTTAVIASITGIQIEDKEKMKMPKTELVSTLRIGVSPTNQEQAPLAAILIRHNGEMPAKTLWQASGLEIDTFYQGLKTEMAKGWIVYPEIAYMKEVEVG